MKKKQGDFCVPFTGTELIKRWSVSWEAIFDWARQEKLTPYEPEPERVKHCVKYDFGMLSSIYTQQEREGYFSQWLYHPSHVETFKKVYGHIIDEWRTKVVSFEDKETSHKEGTIENKDYEGFIRFLQVTHVSDTEIRIGGGGKKAKTYEMKELGFQKENSKTWKEFIETLDRKDHSYSVGKARGAKRVRKTSYDVGQKVLSQINEKLVLFLNKTYQLQLPKRFKVYERKLSEGHGIYGFKFKITKHSDADIEGYAGLSRSKLMSTIEELSEQRQRLSDRGDKKAESQINKITNKLYGAVEIACKKEWLTRHRAAAYLNPPEDDSFTIVPSRENKDSMQEDEDPSQED